MDPVQPPQQYDQQYDPQCPPQYGQQYDPHQYGFPSGPRESSHIREDAAEPAQTNDFTPLALGREYRDVVPPCRYTHGSVVSYLFYNLVNANDKKILISSLMYCVCFFAGMTETPSICQASSGVVFYFFYFIIILGLYYGDFIVLFF
jgi:hypothetical protein